MLIRKITSIILIVIMVSAFAGCDARKPDEIPADAFDVGKNGAEIKISKIQTQETISGFTPVAQNAGLILFVNTVTTEIAVINQASGATWYSNPQDADKDPIATPDSISQMQSQIKATYLDKNNVENQLTNFSSTREYGRYRITGIENGVEVSYVLGNFKPPLYVPGVMTEERYNLFFNKLTDEEEIAEMKKRYRKVSMEILTDPVERTVMLRKYPMLKLQTLYIKYEMKDYVAQRLADILAGAGYVQSDFEYDNAMDTGSVISTKVRIAVSVQYTVKDGVFRVTVPVKKIFIQNESRIFNISILNMFGAGGTWDKGYMFVPDGSGGIIRMNNGKTTTAGYTSAIFSTDASRKDKMGSNPEIKSGMPVFGIKKGDDAFLAVIEGAAAVAKVRADINGKQNSYNFVYPEFCVRDNALSDMGDIAGDVSMRVYQPENIKEDISISYKFLSGEESSYSGMARYYREYLKTHSELKSNEMSKDFPMLIDFYGAVQKNKSIFGIPVQVYVPLTSFEQAQGMIGDFGAAGAGNIDARYISWYNKGGQNVDPSGIKAIPAIGGRKALGSLAEYAVKNNVQLFLDVNLLYISKNIMTDNISIKRDTVHFMDRSTGYIYGKNLVNMKNTQERGKVFILSPNSMPALFDRFAKNLESITENVSLSFFRMNTDVNSDFSRTDSLDRNETVEIYKSVYEAARDKGHGLLMDGTNVYGFAYADGIAGVPYFSNNYRIIDESVPFLQMVLSGSVVYYGTPINTGSDYDKDILRMAETGSGLHATLTHDYDQDIAKSGFDYLFAVSYANWKDKLVSTYTQLDKDLKDITGIAIKEHFVFDQDVTLTAYENGKAVLVNYSDKPQDLSALKTILDEKSAPDLPEMTVPAKSYVVIDLK